MKSKCSFSFEKRYNVATKIKCNIILSIYIFYLPARIIKLITINLSKNLQALSYYSKVCIKWLENV